MLLLIYGIKIATRVLRGRGKSEQIKKGMNELENSLTEAEQNDRKLQKLRKTNEI